MPNQQVINRVKAVCGKNVEYCPEDKCIYYSPNRNLKKQDKTKDVVDNNLADLFSAMKQWKSQNPNEKVKIVSI